MAFEDDIRNRKLALGLPEAATMEELNAATISRVRQGVGHPGRPSVRFIPTPAETQAAGATIRVSVPILSADSAMYSITEDGEQKHIAQLRFMLTKFLVGQLMQSTWVDVRVESDEAVATLNVSKMSPAS